MTYTLHIHLIKLTYIFAINFQIINFFYIFAINFQILKIIYIFAISFQIIKMTYIFAINFQIIPSEILSARTPEVSTSTESTSILEIRRIDVNLTVENVESKSAFLSWRFFSLEEKQFLDGVQIR